MELIGYGRIQAGQIVFEHPLPLPEGAEVVVRIESTKQDPAQPENEVTAGEIDFIDLPFFGMWADREEMRDSTAWVRKEREQWQQRATRQE